MNLYLVRHGETESNVKGKYLGSFEAELSENGIIEIKKARNFIKHVCFDKIFSSEKKRALDSTKILVDKKIIIDHRINERDFGIFDNKTYNEIRDKYPLEQVLWEENWIDYKIPDGESVREVYNRVVDFLRMLEKESYENCLVVTHGGIIRLIYCYILGGDLNRFWKFASKNGSISILKFQYDNWYIDSIIQLDSVGSEYIG